MSAWIVVEYALEVLVAGLVLTALTWAAAERARIHHVARHGSGHRMTADSRRLGIWRVVLNALRIGRSAGVDTGHERAPVAPGTIFQPRASA